MVERKSSEREGKVHLDGGFQGILLIRTITLNGPPDELESMERWEKDETGG